MNQIANVISGCATVYSITRGTIEHDELPKLVLLRHCSLALIHGAHPLI